MRFRTTLVLAAALVVLSLSYYFLELKKAEEEAKTKLASFAEDAVTAFTIRRGDTVIALKRGEERWGMTQPVEDRGDTKEITALLGNITRAKIERTLETKEEQLADFGLKEPAIVLTVHLKDKEEPFTLEVGSVTPAGFSVYTRRAAEDTILLAPSTVKTSLEKEPFSFRSKAPLFFEQDQVTALNLRDRSLHLSLARQEGNEWHISKPIQAKADSKKVADLIRSLTEEQIEGFLDQPPANLNLKKMGLSPSRGEIRLTLEGGAEITLHLGTQKKGGGVYARRSGDKGVLELKEDFRKGLPTQVADLRDRTLLALDGDAVQQIALKNPKGQTFLRKVDGKWRIEQPEQALADQRVIEDLLWDLHGAQVEEFVADKAKNFKRYGLDAPAVTIRLLDQEGKLLASLALKRVAKGEGAYARVGNGQAVYLVGAGLYAQLDKDPLDLRFRRLLSFETWDVGRMTVSWNSQEILLEKREEEWKLKKPREGNANYSAVIDLLNDIRDLKWEKLVTTESTDLPRYGLDTPIVAVTLTKTDGTSLGTVLLGKREGNLVYAKLQGKPEIYGIPSTFLDSLPQEPDTLAE